MMTDEPIDDGRTSVSEVIGILLAHICVFGLGELKITLLNSLRMCIK